MNVRIFLNDYQVYISQVCVNGWAVLTKWLRLIAFEKYCMHFYFRHIFFVFRFRLWAQIFRKMRCTTSSKIFPIFSIGKSLSIQRFSFFSRQFEQLHPMHLNTNILPAFAGLSSIWNEIESRKEEREKDRDVFYLPLVNNQNAKVIR